MLRFAAVAIALLILSPAHAQESKLNTFVFEGVSLNSSLAQFTQKNPSAQYVADSSEKDNGLKCYALTNSKTSDGALFYFLDDKLYNIQILYNGPRITKMGGGDEFYKKLVSAFGDPSDIQRNDKATSVYWKDSSNRGAQVVVSDNSAAVTVMHGETAKVLNQRRAKNTSLGF